MAMNWHLDQQTKNQYLTTIDGVSITIKREDLLHPHVSGNKFRKLKYNFLTLPSTTRGVYTFGGAYSNHLVATAAAGRLHGIPTYGFVRGHELADQVRNPSLAFCEQQGMKLFFLSREDYRKKKQAPKVLSLARQTSLFCIPEGGTNDKAIKGCGEILSETDKNFDAVCCAVGTGGTLKGMMQSGKSGQYFFGFQVVRDQQVTQWLKKNAPKHIHLNLFHEFDFGGYAKTTNELIDFINAFYKTHKILLDPIYTGKLLFGIFALIKSGQWRWGKKVLVIHTGGIQGIKGFNQQQQKKGKQCIDY